MTFLLDVNVLIAILDPDHVAHSLALAWFDETGHRAWATSPSIQNGVIRVMGAATYDTIPFNCAEIAEVLAHWIRAPEHRFWADDVSLLDDRLIDIRQLTSPGRITDSYLLALAAKHDAKLATLDRRLWPDAVVGGREALHVISTSAGA